MNDVLTSNLTDSLKIQVQKPAGKNRLLTQVVILQSQITGYCQPCLEKETQKRLFSTKTGTHCLTGTNITT